MMAIYLYCYLTNDYLNYIIIMIKTEVMAILMFNAQPTRPSF